MHNGRYPLGSVDPGSILWRVFFPTTFFFPSLFQLKFKSWHGFNPYQIPIFFLSLFFFSSFLFSLSFFVLLKRLPPLSSCLPSFFLAPILSLFRFFFPLCFSFSISSSSFILLISSSLSPPLSFCFCFFFLALKFLSYQGGCYENKGKRLVLPPCAITCHTPPPPPPTPLLLQKKSWGEHCDGKIM